MKLLYSILVSALILVGCDGKTGPAGPAGSTGSPVIAFQATFQNGVYPNSFYSGETDTWLDCNAPSTSQYSTSYRRIKTGSALSSYGRVLLKFDVSSLPVNAQIISAAIDLTTETATSVNTNPVTIGIHQLASSLIPSCLWTTSATWGFYSGTTGWNTCDGDVSNGQQGIMNLTPISTVVFPTTATGTSKVYEFTITPSIVQGWLTGTNQGLVLRSEGEFNESVSNVDFYPYNGATGTSPLLIVSYQ